MDNEAAHRLVAALTTLDATDGLVDVLVELGLVTRVDSPKPSILDEEWHKGHDKNAAQVLTDEGYPRVLVYSNIHTGAVVALPDALRALVMIKDAKAGRETHSIGDYIRLLITDEEWLTVTAALKKAGIE